MKDTNTIIYTNKTTTKKEEAEGEKQKQRRTNQP